MWSWVRERGAMERNMDCGGAPPPAQCHHHNAKNITNPHVIITLYNVIIMLSPTLNYHHPITIITECYIIIITATTTPPAPTSHDTNTPSIPLTWLQRHHLLGPALQALPHAEPAGPGHHPQRVHGDDVTGWVGQEALLAVTWGVIMDVMDVIGRRWEIVICIIIVIDVIYNRCNDSNRCNRCNEHSMRKTRDTAWSMREMTGS